MEFFGKPKMPDSVYLSTYIVSLIVAIITLATFLFVFILRSSTMKFMPRGLRFYMCLCYVPFAIILVLTSGVQAVMYIISEAESGLISQISAIAMSFSSQTIRLAFLNFVGDRILATLMLERYTFSEKLLFFWIITAYTFAFSAGHIYVFYKLASTEPQSSLLYFLSFHYVLIIHGAILFVCTFLYLLNKRRYKSTAYKISLARRHKIAENVKILTYVFPSLLLYTIIPPIGIIITLGGNYLNLPQIPYSITQMFTVLPIFFIAIRHYLIKNTSIIPQTAKVTPVTTVVAVPSPEIKDVFGKPLPSSRTTESYFLNLKQQWNE